MTVAGYLERLGLDADLPPTIASLTAIHRAHLEQVPYANLEIMLGRPPSATPADSLARLVGTGLAGYCFHQNGVLEAVLSALGFDVDRRVGHVWTRPEHRDDTELTHLVLVVSGLATEANPDGRWWPDVGLGEGPYDPVPLVAGELVDGPFRFTMSEVTDDATWSFGNDPSGSFTGIEVRLGATDQAAVDRAHAELSTAPTGHFTRILVVQRRDADGIDTVRGCTATRVDAGGASTRDLTSYDAWRGAIEATGLPLGDLDPAELRALFDRSLTAHRAWDEAGRP